MAFRDIFRLVKRLEALVAFQRDCLNEGNWADYDRIENEIRKLEDRIVYSYKKED